MFKKEGNYEIHHEWDFGWLLIIAMLSGAAVEATDFNYYLGGTGPWLHG